MLKKSREEEYKGCPCIAHNVEIVDRRIDNAEDGGSIQWGKATNEVAAKNFSTLQDESWNGVNLTIPMTGLYYMEIGFVRDVGGTFDDVFMHLNRYSSQTGNHVIGTALAGEGPVSNDRKTGHYSIVTLLESGDQLFTTTGSDGSKHAHIFRAYWTTFHLCCNPTLKVPCPCG